VAGAERPWGPLWLWLRGPRVAVGIDSLVEICAFDSCVRALRGLASVFEGCDYVLRMGLDGRPRIALHAGATDETALRALFHCALLESRSAYEGTRQDYTWDEEERALLADTRAIADAHWKRFTTSLKAHGWDAAATRLDAYGPTRIAFEDELILE
jgi:hypothetical protein